MKSVEVRRSIGLPESSFLHLRVGSIANPANPLYRRLGVYFWKDVAVFCLQNRLEIPE
jgi:hypothetical protein